MVAQHSTSQHGRQEGEQQRDECGASGEREPQLCDGSAHGRVMREAPGSWLTGCLVGVGMLRRAPAAAGDAMQAGSGLPR